MPHLHLTGDPEADQLLSEDPFSLLIGMMLDQQIPMEQAFAGPKKILDRLQRVDTSQQVPMSKALSEGKAPAGGRWTDRRSLGHRPNPLSTFSLRTLDSHRLPSSVQNLGASVA